MAEIVKGNKTRAQLLKELENASKNLQFEKAAKKREAKGRSDTIKDIEAMIDDILEQLEKCPEE